MFYLKTFFSVIFKNFSRGLFLLLLTSVCVFALAHKNKIELSLGRWNSAPEDGAYFYALISTKENLTEIRSKLAMLPGVAGVKDVSSEQIMTEVKSILGGSDVTPQMLGFDYQGIKLSFEHTLKAESRQLIREFLTRLCSDGNLIMGAVREVSNEGSPVSGWQKWVLNFWSLWAVLIFFWSILFISLFPSLRTYAYLVEKYQRRHAVAMKSAALGMAFWIFISVLLSFVWWPVDLYFLPIVFLMPLVSLFSGMKKFVWGK